MILQTSASLTTDAGRVHRQSPLQPLPCRNQTRHPRPILPHFPYPLVQQDSDRVFNICPDMDNHYRSIHGRIMSPTERILGSHRQG